MITNLAIIILILLLIGGALFAFRIIIHANHWFQLRVMLIVTYLVVNILSGIFHLADISGVDRGYYDIIKNINTNYDKLLIAVLCTVAGFVALLSGISFGKKINSKNVILKNQIDYKSKKILTILIMILFPISIYAIFTLYEFIENENVRRIIALTDGMARFGFMAHWFTWVVSFAAILLVTKPIFKSSRRKSLLLLLSVSAIFISLDWTGGRSIGLMMSLPLIMVFMRFKLYQKLNLILIFTFILSAYVVYLTEYRKQDLLNNNKFSIISAVDWELGRFSMIGFSIDYVERYGHTIGETMYAGLFNIPYALMKLFGMTDNLWIPRVITELSGSFILGNQSLQYIVPGFSAELYLNFGIIGIVVGYFFLGQLGRVIENSYVSSGMLIEILPLCYFGVILIFCVIPAQSGAIFGYLIFSGLPLLFLFALNKLKIDSKIFISEKKINK